MIFKKKLYYVTHVVSTNIFSANGYVIVYYDKNMKKIYGKFDLESFYSYFKFEKYYKFIHLGGVFDA